MQEYMMQISVLRVRNDKYIADQSISYQTCRGCVCRDKQRRRNFRKGAVFHYADPQKLAVIKWIIVGTIQATLAL